MDTKKLIMNTLKNNVQLIGHLGKDPELKTFDTGKTKLSATMATNEYYKNKDGDTVNDTTWHNIVAWGKTAEQMDKLLSKGNELAVKGKLASRSYDDKEGNKRYITEVVVNEFVKITKKEELPF